MMVKNRGIERSDYQWFRTFVKLNPGVAMATVRARLDASLSEFLRYSATTIASGSKSQVNQYALQKLLMDSAMHGVSGLQTQYGASLGVLGLLVGMVFVLACANVANLMAVNAKARAHEMALRISIGAARWRLLQLVFLESALLMRGPRRPAVSSPGGPRHSLSG